MSNKEFQKIIEILQERINAHNYTADIEAAKCEALEGVLEKLTSEIDAEEKCTEEDRKEAKKWHTEVFGEKHANDMYGNECATDCVAVDCYNTAKEEYKQEYNAITELKNRKVEKADTDDEIIKAIEINDINAVTEWINKRQNINIGLNTDGNITLNALQYASSFGRLHIVNLLLHAGAFTNPKCCSALPALNAAAFNNHSDVMLVLLCDGADINSVGENGMTSLMKAIDLCYDDTALMLIEKGADITLKDKEGRNAFDFRSSLTSQRVIDKLNKLSGDVKNED